MCTKNQIPRFLFNFDKWPKTALLKIRYSERLLSKNLKKVDLFFSFAPVPSYRQDYEKKWPRASYQSVHVVK